MVVIPAGEFHNGIAAGRVERSNDESPQRRVTIAKPFAVGNEVTSLQPPQELRRADVVPTGHVEQNDPGLQRLGDDGHFVQPLATPLDATRHLDPSRPMGFGDTHRRHYGGHDQLHGLEGSMIPQGNATCGLDSAYVVKLPAVCVVGRQQHRTKRPSER